MKVIAKYPSKSFGSNIPILKASPPATRIKKINGIIMKCSLNIECIFANMLSIAASKFGVDAKVEDMKIKDIKTKMPVLGTGFVKNLIKNYKLDIARIK